MPSAHRMYKIARRRSSKSASVSASSVFFDSKVSMNSGACSFATFSLSWTMTAVACIATCSAFSMFFGCGYSRASNGLMPCDRTFTRAELSIVLHRCRHCSEAFFLPSKLVSTQCSRSSFMDAASSANWRSCSKTLFRGCPPSASIPIDILARLPSFRSGPFSCKSSE